MRSTLAVAALAALCACVSPGRHREALGANQALKAEIASLTESQQQLMRENERLRADRERYGKLAADADSLRAAQDHLNAILEQYHALNAPGLSHQLPAGVDVVSTAEGQAFRMLGGVLFEPGQIEISAQGRGTLRELVARLEATGKQIRVDGHTDDMPIQHSPWKTNLRLSVERAMAVADVLIENGLPRERVAVAGFGPFRPSAAGTTDEARQQNRRVEILMLDQ